MNEPSSLITTLEDLLVREFRVCQSIFTITKDERLSLSKNDVATLSTLTEQKEALLDELGQIEDQRRMVAQELSNPLGINSPSPTIADISAVLNSEVGSRISRLREGILALAEKTRNLTGGNHALAISALERTDALQTFLLDILKPTLFYQPPGTTSKIDPDIILGVDQRT
jgi:flagellar biosynthesis/type III secretory pathway chaperone